MAGWASRGITAGRLTDGRVQMFAADAAGEIWSAWQGGLDWVYWSRFNGNPALFHAVELDVAPLSDGRMQIWSVDNSGVIWSCWKTTTNANAAWSSWTSHWTGAAPPFAAVQVAAAPLSDGRLQFWAVDNKGTIWSAWKASTDPNAAWTAWTSHWAAAAPPFTAVQVAAAPLSDGRLQFWAVDNKGTIWSAWKASTDPNAAWTAWTSHWTAAAPPFVAARVSAAPLSDKRLQFFAVDTNGTIWSAWKATTDPSAAWTQWTKAWIADQTVFKTRSLWTSRFGDGRLSVWVIDSNGEIRTTSKTTTSSTAAWTNWALQFSMVAQEQSNWCWSGCGTALSHFFDPASGWTQCTLANSAVGSTTCCVNPGPCNVYGFLNQAFNIVGHFDHMDNSNEPDTTITAQVVSGLPLGIRIAWRGGGAHFIIATGGGPNNMVTIKDPIYGLSYITWATLNSNYQGSGDWTHSYFTK